MLLSAPLPLLSVRPLSTRTEIPIFRCNFPVATFYGASNSTILQQSARPACVPKSWREDGLAPRQSARVRGVLIYHRALTTNITFSPRDSEQKHGGRKQRPGKKSHCLVEKTSPQHPPSPTRNAIFSESPARFLKTPRLDEKDSTTHVKSADAYSLLRSNPRPAACWHIRCNPTPLPRCSGMKLY